MDLDAIARQTADALLANDWESAISLLAELSPGQLATVKAKVLARGAPPAMVEETFGMLQPSEVINLSGRAPSQVTLIGVLVLVGIAIAGYATHEVKQRRRA